MKYIYYLNAGRTAVERHILRPDDCGVFYLSFSEAKEALRIDIERSIYGADRVLRDAKERLKQAKKQTRAITVEVS